MSNIFKIIIKNLISILLAGSGVYFLSSLQLSTYFRLFGGCPIDTIGFPADYSSSLHCVQRQVYQSMVQLITGVILFVIFYLVLRRILNSFFK